jgi:hypothetical protein
LASPNRDPLRLTASAVDHLLKKRVGASLSFYDGTTHAGLFHIPLPLRKILKAEKRVITARQPIHFYKS